jgi:hypothetical protein
MRQIRIAKSPKPTGGRQLPLPVDPRDPDIVHAHRAARRTGDTRAGRNQPAGRPHQAWPRREPLGASELRQSAAGLSAWHATLGGMTARPAGRSGGNEQSAFHGDHDIIHLGGEAAVVVPVDEYRRLRALESLASPQELEGAEAAAALDEYREWSAAGRPGAVPHAEARKLLLGEDR